ncbi:hypothetical protein IDH31_00320 [Pelagibacterales bacterium SAG-MED32]|nr:hypothetical protein [Pelagibacterales bacterium SAG-MED32]
MSKNIKKRRGFFFVGSTLPLKHIEADNQYDIKYVFTVGKTLKLSVREALRNKSTIKVIPISLNIFIQTLQLTLLFLFKRLSGINLTFFHEISIFIFDLFVIIFNIKSTYIPQVTLNSFKKTKDLPKGNLKTIIINCFNLNKYFCSWQMPKGDNGGYSDVFAVHKYPSNIKKGKKKTYINKFSSPKNMNCLLIVANDIGSMEHTKKIYRSISDHLIQSGHKLFIKDHPRQSARLSLSIKDSTSLSPYMPYEFIPEDFCILIGCASTALCNAPSNTKIISILNLMDCNREDINLRKKHLESLNSLNPIVFIDHVDEIKQII